MSEKLNEQETDGQQNEETMTEEDVIKLRKKYMIKSFMNILASVVSAVVCVQVGFEIFIVIMISAAFALSAVLYGYRAKEIADLLKSSDDEVSSK